MVDSALIENFRNDENINDDDVVARIMAVVTAIIRKQPSPMFQAAVLMATVRVTVLRSQA